MKKSTNIITWQQSITWHINQYEKTGKIYYLAAALSHLKANMPHYYQQLRQQLLKQLKTK